MKQCCCEGPRSEAATVPRTVMAIMMMKKMMTWNGVLPQSSNTHNLEDTWTTTSVEIMWKSFFFFFAFYFIFTYPHGPVLKTLTAGLYAYIGVLSGPVPLDMFMDNVYFTFCITLQPCLFLKKNVNCFKINTFNKIFHLPGSVIFKLKKLMFFSLKRTVNGLWMNQDIWTQCPFYEVNLTYRCIL